MATPFDAKGGIDFGAARGLARYLVEQGSHGLVVAGTTGESPTLDDSEKLALLAAVIDEVGERADVICGTGSNDTRHSAELTAAAADVGADAALVVTPYYNKPNRLGILGHFAAVAEAAPSLPIIVYNIPSRVVVNIGPELLAELAEIETVVAVKQANNDELQQVDGLALLAGNDEAFLPVLRLGGAGGILVASHLAGPRMREIWDAAQAGDLDRAAEIDRQLAPLYAAMSVTTNPIPVKAALEMLDIIPGHMRLPMVEASEEEKAVVAEALRDLGVGAAEA